MAKVTISIFRDSGTTINATADVPDEQIVDMAAMLGAMIFDATAAPTPAPAPEANPVP